MTVKLRTSMTAIGAVVAALLTATLTNPTVALAEPEATEECADYTFIAARGSGELDDDRTNGMGVPLFATYNKLGEYFQPFGLSLDYYRITGYRAVSVGDLGHRAWGFMNSYDAGLDFSDSVRTGTNAIVDAVQTVRDECPSSRIILGGYSQGAEAIGYAVGGRTYETSLQSDTEDLWFQNKLTKADKEAVSAVVLYGDPKFNARDAAVNESDFDPSHYGLFEPHDLWKQYIDAPVISYCHLADIICNHDKKWFNVGAYHRDTFWVVAAEKARGRQVGESHTNYDKDAKYAAAKVANALDARTLVASPLPSENMFVLNTGWGQRPERWKDTRAAIMKAAKSIARVDPTSRFSLTLWTTRVNWQKLEDQGQYWDRKYSPGAKHVLNLTDIATFLETVKNLKQQGDLFQCSIGTEAATHLAFDQPMRSLENARRQVIVVGNTSCDQAPDITIPRMEQERVDNYIRDHHAKRSGWGAVSYSRMAGQAPTGDDDDRSVKVGGTPPGASADPSDEPTGAPGEDLGAEPSNEPSTDPTGASGGDGLGLPGADPTDEPGEESTDFPEPDPDADSVPEFQEVEEDWETAESDSDYVIPSLVRERTLELIAPGTVYAGDPATFNPHLTDDDGSAEVRQYAWNYSGQGSSNWEYGAAASTHTFQSAGTYDVTLNLWLEGVFLEATVPVTVLDKPQSVPTGLKDLRYDSASRTLTWTPRTEDDGYIVRGADDEVLGAFSLPQEDDGRLVIPDALTSFDISAVNARGEGYPTQVDAPVEKPMPKLFLKDTSAVSVTGSWKVGSTITAKPGTWNTSGITFTYKWSRNGTAISGATKSTYTTTSKDVGQRLTVTVTGKKTGYTSGTATGLSGRIYK